MENRYISRIRIHLLSCLFILAALNGYSQLDASFTTTSQQGCAPFSVNFTNTSTGASSYQWIFGNGNFSTLTNPQNVYVSPGAYTVSLIAIAGNGARDTATIQSYIQAMPGPPAAFIQTLYSGCAGETNFSFTNTSTGAQTSFWDFDDGTSSVQVNPTKIYATPGIYHVSLVVTNASGCQTVFNDLQPITIHAVPAAGFSASPTITCNVNQPFQFTSTAANATSYLWSFGDGTTSTLANPSKTYASTGVYTIRQIVSGSGNCRDTLIRTNYITIHPAIVPAIVATDSAGCKPFATTFSTPVNATAYSWNFGNGQTSSASGFLANYPQNGLFNVSLTVTMTNGCTYTNTQNNFIEAFNTPVAAFTVGNSQGCAPLTVNIDNQSTGATSYLWGFSDNTSSSAFEPVKTFNVTGSYNISLTARNANGCTKTLTLNNIVSVVSPVCSFTADDQAGCPPFNVNFSNTSAGVTSSLWNFGDGTTSTLPNPSHTYTNLGAYTVTLISTNANGCVDTHTETNYINVNYDQPQYIEPPVISGCAPFSSSFSLDVIPGTTYLWNFGDGTTSVSASPSHTYDQPGIYTVSLLINNGSACASFFPAYQVIHVEGEIPVFQVDISSCPPFPVTFTDTSSNSVSWLWNFGDGVMSTEQSPVHIFTDQDVHHVGLTVTSSAGCSYTYIGFNSVNFSETSASFSSSYPGGPFPQTVSFTSNNSEAISWLWDFGDGTTSTEENPVHTYSVYDDYQVSLTITTPVCQLTSTGTAFGDAAAALSASEPGTGGSSPPEAAEQIEPLRGCAPSNIHFFRQDTSHIVLQWNFGDGTTSILQSPTHLYSQPGSFIISYIAMTSAGQDTFSYPQPVYIGGGAPDFTSSQEDYCAYSEVSLNAINPARYDSITWYFSDGVVIENDFSPTHQFAVSNTSYSILLTTVDSVGCTSSKLSSIFTNPSIPEIFFQRRVCKDTVTFSHGLPSTYSFFWNFGDGTTSSEDTPWHFYTVAGTYNFTVNITYPSGCSNTIHDSVIVYFPVADFVINTPSQGCVPLTVSLTNTSTGFFGGPQGNYTPAFNWNFGQNLQFVFTSTTNRTYTTAGSHVITMFAYDWRMPGCSSIFRDTVIGYTALAEFTLDQENECLPIEAQFQDLSEDAVSWEWDFGNGLTSNLQHPVISFQTIPEDSVELTITDIHGCVDSVTHPGIESFNAAAVASFVGTCNPLSVQFTLTDSGMIGWVWDFGDGTTGTGLNPSHVYTTTGTFYASVFISYAGGCVQSLEVDVPVVVTQPLANFSSPTPANCAPSIVEFVDASVDAVAWLWSFGDNTSSTVQNPVKLYDNPGTYDISLIVTAASGCTDTLLNVDYVTVLGPATSFTASVNETCENVGVTFTDQSNGAVEWEWNFGEGSVSTEQNPHFTYAEAGSYIITLFSKDSIGCSAFYTIPLPMEVYPPPVAYFTVDDSAACTPYSPVITNTSQGAVTYAWDLGGTTSNAQTPAITFNNAGIYNILLIATTEHGCSDTSVITGLQAMLVPVAGFTLNETEGCTPLSVTFNNSSYQTIAPAYNWEFGQGSSSVETSPTNVYYDPGFYTVGLSVTNSNGCSDTISLPSIIQVFDTLAAPVSPIVRVTVENGTSVLVEWEESLAPDFGAYSLYRKNLVTGLFELIVEVFDAHTLNYTDNSLNTFENVYCYRLATRDRCGYSIELDSLIDHCTINVEATTQENNTIDIRWTPYIGKIPSQYRVFRTEENSTIMEDLGTVAGDVTSFTDTTVYCPVKFKYDIKAEGLNGQWHVESNSDYDLSNPIQNLYAEQKVNIARSTVSDNMFVLTEWPVPEIMGYKVTGYKVFRSTDNLSFELLASVSANQMHYLDQSVNVNKIKYYYRVMATNACDLIGIEGQSSDNIVLTSKDKDDLHIQLDWTPYEGWGSNGVGWYIIERQKADDSWEIIHQVPGSVITTVDEN